MINNLNLEQIRSAIEQAINQPFTILKTYPVSGGCINSAYKLQGLDQCFFIKLNRKQLLPMFKAEFSGLKEILQTQTVRVPQPLTYGDYSDTAFLVLEHISLSSKNSQSEQQLGSQLAALHQVQQKYFGWHQNNTIGSTKQINTASENWVTFWRENRLDYQLTLAEKNGCGKKLIQSGDKLCASLDLLFTHYTPSSSLLHGDLWSGNAAVTEHNEPVIYDPACYYGDRETDIAMTELFAGFGPDFYAAYNETYPLHTDYRIRKTLYNLYHILNHFNLFGEAYLSQAQRMIDSLLAELCY